MRRYTVPALAEELDNLVQSRYPSIIVEGEVGQVQIPASGHCYLQLRDKGGPKNLDCTLAAVVWRDDWNRLRYRPKQGDRVLCRGRVSIYTSKSAVQLYVTDIAPAGLGDQQKEIEARKARLLAEGLMDPRRKRPLPKQPRVVGVATSLTGAALQDFLEVSRVRWPCARILVAGCVVQGVETPSSVIRAIELLIEDGRSQVIVVTRGGGSKEDLMPFNDEQLARFLASCPVPVVSAVGHQIDTTIADLVADAVAPTPSAAAMLVFPDARGIVLRVDEADAALRAAITRALRRNADRVAQWRARLRDPRARVASGRVRLDDLAARLQIAVHRPMRVRLDRLLGAHARLHPAAVGLLADKRRRMDALVGRLHALSPNAVLERGYAIVRGKGGVITDPAALVEGQVLDVRVAAGTFAVRVTDGKRPVEQLKLWGDPRS